MNTQSGETAAFSGHSCSLENDRRTVFIALTVISLVGTVLFFLIRKPDPENVPGEEESCDDQDMEATESAQNNVTKAVDAFKKSLKLCVTKEMLLLSVTTAYTGLELTFFSGVYGTCIGAVNKFGKEEKSLIGLSGIFIGIGEILGGSLFGLLSKNNRFGRNPVVLLGTLVHFLAFYLIFLNMPGDAPIAPVEGTNSSAYIRPSKEVAILCSFLLGLGDSCFNTQLLSILGFLYAEDSAPAFAVFKFVQSICAAMAFFYSNYLLLHWQLLVMVIFAFFGTISFFAVEWDAAAIVARGSDYRSI
ncbi:UNC93-like protein MFSD11 isoform X3 [Meriones unguiculatus]|uniref:UNC93-like protein MFSD11 isoform X3 n=1 Tax=Meriones unguiculatus TaxID=10047 RepID=UPI00293EDB7B|nr:UNC93-like protein MFSD11 isoform X3 [Meriones unguiculatus]XP_060242311.1 UNC93-like protein MFSD11 isoform X3 [Meriones unguiculatus]